MSSLLDFYDDPFWRTPNGNPYWINPLQKSPAVRTYDWLYDNSHGANRRMLAEVPVLGWWRNVRDEARRAQDYYNNTNEDPNYMSQYRGNAGSISGIAGPISSVPRMARSLASLYPAEVMEVAQMRRDGYRASREAADHWKSAWQEYNRRFE